MPDNLIVENIYMSDYDNENENDMEQLATDVIVTMKNKAKYVATFYTYEYLKNIIIKEKSKDQSYWCMTPFTLVESIDGERMKKIVEEMIDRGDFQLMFLKLN